ncbi:GntR family transcriptional regulator [Paenibacillus sp. GCM10023252]|uniref:GntR family transcriptional regulator n=1 Tax=Paenibacillus sp. GCM10023252 TaxID=3252649 RepID=UPI00361172DC
MTITLKEKAYIQLRQLILGGEIKPGVPVTEQSLVDRLQMSRTPIRAAMERLAAEGLVNYSSNKGLSIAEMSLQRIVDFFDYRVALEGYIARKLAARAWSEEEKSWFKDNLAAQEQCMKELDFAGFTQADSDFHRQLVHLYDNQEMIQTMDQLQDKLYLTALKVLRKDNSRIQQSYADHVAIAQHLMQGNAEEASRLMVDHLEYGKQILIL